ncbi:MAG: histidine phosphatase family protein, partial [Candidatus Thermoplasmatota archaeon]
HAERDGDEDLTPRGLAQARRARETLALPYDAYYVSPAKRARLTMAAFGIEDATVEERIAPRPKPPFARFGSRHKELMAAGMDHVSAWFAIPGCVPMLLENGRTALAGVLAIAAKLPDGARALAVSHGGTIEPLAVAATGRSFEDLFGRRELGYCEGIRATVRDGSVRDVEVVRLRR